MQAIPGDFLDSGSKEFKNLNKNNSSNLNNDFNSLSEIKIDVSKNNLIDNSNGNILANINDEMENRYEKAISNFSNPINNENLKTNLMKLIRQELILEEEKIKPKIGEYKKPINKED